jgi:diacylglycerol kinase (ATP)
MRQAYLIYNPHAGRFPSWILAERAAGVLREHDWQIKMVKAEAGIHITEFSHEAVEQGMDAIFIVGGDGSLNLALPALVNTNTALGVLPAGTSNVFAQEIGLPGLAWTRWMALEESARRLASACIYEVDTGVCGDSHFLLWSGIGLDGFIVHRIEPRPRWEKYFAVVHYAASAVWNASMWHGVNLSFVVDGKEISGHYILAVINNIHLYAGGLAQLSPQAFLDDGLMDLWLFKGDNLGDVVQHAWDVLSGRHLESEKAERIPFRSIQVHTASDLYIQVDGEPLINPEQSISIGVKPRSLKVLIPEFVPRDLFCYTVPPE